MKWLLLACAYSGLVAGMIGGNVVWLMHCHRTGKRSWDWFHGPTRDGQWKGLNRREKRKLLLFMAITLASFVAAMFAQRT